MNKQKESILVVPRAALEFAGMLAATPGVMPVSATVAGALRQLVAEQGLFLPRGAMESDPTYKQIIPYMVFMHARRIFVMQRSAAAGEQRLAGAYTVGIGGHVRKDDLAGNAAADLAQWGQREFAEEIAYGDGFSAVNLLGLVNDDTNEVGRVHVGLVFVLQAHSDCIAVRSELQSGVLMDREQCLAVFDHMESWSKMVCTALMSAHLL